MMSLHQRVDRGISWLDNNAPEDWRERIGSEPFTDEGMRGIRTCVLGRVYGSLYTAKTGLMILADYGFNSGVSIGYDTTFEDVANEWNHRLGLGGSR